MKSAILKKNLFALLMMATSGSLALPDLLQGQIRAGSAFLKILPGTRQQNMAGSLTAGLDEAYSVYANPAAIGQLREWQLSTSVNKWIADISNVSMFAGKAFRLRTPWSNKLNLAVGLNFQGVDEFDATQGTAPAASAQDVLATISLGMPLGHRSRSVSLGASVKYLKTDLADFSASTAVFDVGMLYRSPRIPFRFLLFEELIISSGLAVNQLGSSLKFISESTPLPRTVRAGLAVNLGRHDGLRIQLAGDYEKVRDEDGRFNIGAEIVNLFAPLSKGWGRTMAVRGGYTFNRDRDSRLLQKFSIGLSLRLDDYMNSETRATRVTFLTRNSALRADAGLLRSSTFTNSTQGSVSLQPIGPEPFQFTDSDFYSYAPGDTSNRPFGLEDLISLQWESTHDPDLFDHTNHILLLVKEDRAALQELVERSDQNDFDIFRFTDTPDYPYIKDSTRVHFLYFKPAQLTAKNGFGQAEIGSHLLLAGEADSLLDEESVRLTYPIQPDYQLDAGNYYWASLAFDKNRHLRYAQTNGSRVAHFRVEGEAPRPDLTVRITEVAKEVPSTIQRIVLGDVNFAPDSSSTTSLSESSKDALQGWVEHLKSDSNAVLIEVAAHSDPSGPEIGSTPIDYRKAYNASLSEARANSIRNYLLQNGFPADSVTATGYGESKPLPQGPGESKKDWWARCRRVELLVNRTTTETKHFADVTFSNVGGAAVESVSVHVLNYKELQPELLQELQTSIDPIIPTLARELSINQRVLLDTTLVKMAPGASRTFRVPWDAGEWPDLVAVIDKDDNIAEIDEPNNRDWHKLALDYDLTLAQEVSEFSVESGDTVTYTLTVSNNGPSTSRNITLRNTLSPFLEVVPNSVDGIPGSNTTFDPWVSNTLIWSLPALPAGSSRSVQFKVQIGEIENDETVPFINRSTVTSPDDINPDNDFASTTIQASRSNFDFKDDKGHESPDGDKGQEPLDADKGKLADDDRNKKPSGAETGTEPLDEDKNKEPIAGDENEKSPDEDKGKESPEKGEGEERLTEDTRKQSRGEGESKEPKGGDKDKESLGREPPDENKDKESISGNKNEEPTDGEKSNVSPDEDKGKGPPEGEKDKQPGEAQSKQPPEEETGTHPLDEDKNKEPLAGDKEKELADEDRGETPPVGGKGERPDDDKDKLPGEETGNQHPDEDKKREPLTGDKNEKSPGEDKGKESPEGDKDKQPGDAQSKQPPGEETGTEPLDEDKDKEPLVGDKEKEPADVDRGEKPPEGGKGERSDDDKDKLPGKEIATDPLGEDKNKEPPDGDKGMEPSSEDKGKEPPDVVKGKEPPDGDKGMAPPSEKEGEEPPDEHAANRDPGQPDLILRLDNWQINEGKDGRFLTIDARLRNPGVESTPETTVRVQGHGGAGPAISASRSRTPPNLVVSATKWRSEAVHDGQLLTTVANIRTRGDGWAPTTLVRIEAPPARFGQKRSVLQDTVEFRVPELGPGNELPVEIKLRIPSARDTVVKVRPEKTVILRQDATIFVPRDTAVVVRYDTVIVGIDTTVIVRRDTVIVGQSSTLFGEQNPIVRIRRDTTVIEQPDTVLVTEFSNAAQWPKWLILVVILALAAAIGTGALADHYISNVQNRKSGKPGLLFVFYDVKQHRKVMREVIAKTVYEAKGKKTHAFKGKTEDGRNLTKFVSQADYDQLDIPAESGGPGRPSSKAGKARVKLRGKISTLFG